MFHSFNKYLGDCYNTDIISFIDRIIICVVYDVKGSTEKNTDNKNFTSAIWGKSGWEHSCMYMNHLTWT